MLSDFYVVRATSNINSKHATLIRATADIITITCVEKDRFNQFLCPYVVVRSFRHFRNLMHYP